MTFAYWMLIAAALMPYFTIALAKSGGSIDNRAPRLGLEYLSRWRQRAQMYANRGVSPYRHAPSRGKGARAKRGKEERAPTER